MMLSDESQSVEELYDKLTEQMALMGTTLHTMDKIMSTVSQSEYYTIDRIHGTHLTHS